MSQRDMETGLQSLHLKFLFTTNTCLITNGNLAGTKLQTFKSQKETKTKVKDGHDTKHVEKEKVQI